MAKMTSNKNWLTMTVFLIIMMITPTFSADKEASMSANDGSRLVNLLTSMRTTIGGRSQSIRKLSSRIEEVTSNSQSVQTNDQRIGQNYYASDDSGSCGIQCLECKDGECTRYNWIGVICLVMLIINVLALVYWILLIRKKGRRSTTKDSLLTEIGSISISRSVTFD